MKVNKNIVKHQLAFLSRSYDASTARLRQENAWSLKAGFVYITSSRVKIQHGLDPRSAAKSVGCAHRCLTAVCNSSSRGPNTPGPSGALSKTHIENQKILNLWKKISRKQSILCILGGSLKNWIKMLSSGLISVKCYCVDNESYEALYSNKKTGNLKVFKSHYPSVRIPANTTYLKTDRGWQEGSVSSICRANWAILSPGFRTRRKVDGENWVHKSIPQNTRNDHGPELWWARRFREKSRSRSVIGSDTTGGCPQ